jgi:hypothetical protein
MLPASDREVHMRRFLVVGLLLACVPAPSLTAASPTVEVANGDWSYLPVMRQRSNEHLSDKAIFRLHEIAQAGKCRLPGRFNGTRLDFGLSFAAQFNPDGSLNRIVMPRLGCPEAEGILGGVLLKMLQSGDYKPDGSSDEGWYRGELTFGVRG